MRLLNDKNAKYFNIYEQDIFHSQLNWVKIRRVIDGSDRVTKVIMCMSLSYDVTVNQWITSCHK